ncbi:hypothetical protein M426DRAFT_118288 [Hypoxylon sp. CI-4A]|nr:hypothetical protein M426DRAFT_118288 [Hypoxylon sp. CI-4A]
MARTKAAFASSFTNTNGSDEPLLCPEQEHLVNLIVSGRNVFYTGSAGSGKSTVLKAFTQRLQALGKTVCVVAPTGRAALQVNGTTTWAYAGWTPQNHKRPLQELKMKIERSVQQRFRNTDVLVIDEISLVENHHLERLNEVMKEARLRSKLPFGGVQLVVTGDFCQLPPVKPFQFCIECGFELTEKYTAQGKKHVCRQQGKEYCNKDKWAFRSKAWQESNFTHVHLDTVHRQKDQTFISILQKVRFGEQLTPLESDILVNHECTVENAVRLYPTRHEAARINQQEYKKLQGADYMYWCLDSFMWSKKLHPQLGWKRSRKAPGPQSEGPLHALQDHQFEECVQLKRGMLVVLLVNLDLAAGLCNGSQGVIWGFEAHDPNDLPLFPTKPYGSIKSDHIKRFIMDSGVSHKVWPIVRFHNGQMRTIYAHCSINEQGDKQPYSLLIRTQIPLAPAWAMTIHKSQGLTLDRAIVDLSKAFESGQVYVALSRVRELRGLKIEGDTDILLDGFEVDEGVRAFHRRHFSPLQWKSYDW